MIQANSSLMIAGCSEKGRFALRAKVQVDQVSYELKDVEYFIVRRR